MPPRPLQSSIFECPGNQYLQFLIDFQSFRATQPSKPLSIQDGDGGMRGAFRRPPKVVQGVLDIPNILKINASSWLYPSTFLYLLHLKASPPSLFLSPGGRAFRRADPKIFLCSLVGRFFCIFWPSKTLFEKCFEKTSKKMLKSMPLAFQSPSKILPK